MIDHLDGLPRSYLYTLVLVSLTKRVLLQEIPDDYRLKFLDHLNRMECDWLDVNTIAAVEPMCDRGYAILKEADGIDRFEKLEIYANVFPTFAELNPSLLLALKASPRSMRITTIVTAI